MIKTIVELVLRVTNLLEAEGRAARAGALQFVTAGAVMLIAALLALLGIIVLGAALFIGLVETMHPAWALVIVGVVFLLLAFGAGLAGKASIQTRKESSPR